MTVDTDNHPAPAEFDDIANVLVGEGVQEISPAELHGLLSGALVAGARPDPAAWLQLAATFLEIGDFTQETSKVRLLEMFQHALTQLEGTELDFDLMLPDDDELLSLRAACLGQWCQGFLSGFGQYGKQTDDSLSKESREVLTDLSEIAQIVADDDDGEEGESNLMEVEEYVRMAALMLFAECNKTPEDSATAPATPQTLH
ncbi:UPF0149 family protein [Marinobacterium rhizophilum]|uniref:UPF0149 family protein n=1 Tax=Marinobacterium rhizophilum TaxID=420402 RepID=UPI00036D35D7|nr:UPF0149 family protein [Marinobacterium rhizophilum]